MADAGCFERVAAIVESPSLTSSAALGRSSRMNSVLFSWFEAWNGSE